MRIGYLECFAGISGDMLMGALVDAGAPIELLQRTAASLALGAELRVTRVSRSGIQSTKIDVMVNGQLHEPAAATGPIEQEERTATVTISMTTIMNEAMTISTSTQSHNHEPRAQPGRDSQPAHARGV